jgi:hypothetical protein
MIFVEIIARTIFETIRSSRITVKEFFSYICVVNGETSLFFLVVIAPIYDKIHFYLLFDLL